MTREFQDGRNIKMKNLSFLMLHLVPWWPCCSEGLTTADYLWWKEAHYIVECKVVPFSTRVSPGSQSTFTKIGILHPLPPSSSSFAWS